MFDCADADALRRSAVMALAPGQNLTPTQSAECTLIDHKTKLQWSSEKTPYMVDPLNLLSSRKHRELIVMGPSRSGKTFAIACGGLAYIMTEAPGETMFVQMNMGEADDWAKVELEGTLSNSPKLAAMRLTGVGDDTDKLKRFDRMTLRVAWPSRGKLSGKTERYVFIIDGDNGTGDLSIEEAFALAQVRIRTYLSAGMCVAEGNCAKDFSDARWRGRTPHEAPPASGMASLYNGGSRHCRYWPCPHCLEFFQVKAGLELFRLPDMEAQLEMVRGGDLMVLADQYARIICPHCLGEIRQDSREQMERRGHWVAEGQTITSDGTIHGDAPRNPRASYWIAGVQAAFNQWHEMLLKLFRELRNYDTTGDCKAYGHVLNTEFCYPHIPFAIMRQKSKHNFEGRLESWPVQTVPQGVRFLIASVDVQGNRFIVQVTGFGVGLESWVVDYYAIRHTVPGGSVALSPHSMIEHWQRLKGQVINRRYALNDGSGRSMPMVLTLIDSGGRATDKEDSVTAKAYEFWRALSPVEKSRCRLVKGTGNAKENVTESLVSGNVALLLIKSDAYKDQIENDLKRTDDGPGKMHFSSDLKPDYFAELTTAEIKTAKGWAKVGSNVRNEALDLTVYARAGAEHLKMSDPRRWANPPGWAMEWDSNSAVNGQPATPQIQRQAQQRGVRSSTGVFG